MKYPYLWSFVFFTLMAVGCGPQNKQTFGSDIDTSPDNILTGMETFDRWCASCHNFDRNGIGPNLSGLTRTVETDWIREFIRDPHKMIQAKDPRAIQLFQKYKVYMQGFPHLSETEMNGIISYLHTFEGTSITKSKNLIPPILNPIKDTVASSGLVVELELIGQVPASMETSPKARINKMECEGKSGRIFINDLRGSLYELSNGNFHVFLSINTYMADFIHQPGLGTGLGSFAFHPDFERNGLFYTTHTEPGRLKKGDFGYAEEIGTTLQWVITEWQSENPSEDVFSGSHRELMRIDFVSGLHGVQEIGFDPNLSGNDPDFGMLYIAIGDGGSVENGFVDLVGHQGKKVWGSILRIDPTGRNSDNGKYGIPKDNPYKEYPGMAKEVWAYGFRNPNRLTWDNDGSLLATDIGQSNIEEVNKIEAGKFYGWPFREGTFLIDPKGDLGNIYPLPEDDTAYGVEYPLIQYDHDESTAIIGGYVVNDPIFKGKYIFGDIVTGRLFYSDISGDGPIKIEEWKLSYKGNPVDLYGLTESSRVDLRFGKDCEGNTYILTKADGKVYKIKADHYLF